MCGWGWLIGMWVRVLADTCLTVEIVAPTVGDTRKIYGRSA
jgi:hypothetical protein